MTSLFADALRALESPVAPPSLTKETKEQGKESPPLPTKEERDDPELALMDGLYFCVTEPAPDQRMPCLAEMAAASDDERCQTHLVFLNQKGCPYCAQAEAQSRALIDEGKIEPVDIHSERGRKLAKESGIDFTPGLLVVGCDDKVRAVLDNPLHPRLVWREDDGPTQERSVDDDETDEQNKSVNVTVARLAEVEMEGH